MVGRRGGRDLELNAETQRTQRKRREDKTGDPGFLCVLCASALNAKYGLDMKAQVTLYTRVGCCLCDEAKEVIAAARRRADFDYAEIDIDGDPELVRLYNVEVPVVTINRRKAFKYKVDMNELLKKLAASI